jgi:hypothetical protein
MATAAAEGAHVVVRQRDHPGGRAAAHFLFSFSSCRLTGHRSPAAHVVEGTPHRRGSANPSAADQQPTCRGILKLTPGVSRAHMMHPSTSAQPLQPRRGDRRHVRCTLRASLALLLARSLLLLLARSFLPSHANNEQICIINETHAPSSVHVPGTKFSYYELVPRT